MLISDVLLSCNILNNDVIYIMKSIYILMGFFLGLSSFINAQENNAQENKESMFDFSSNIKTKNKEKLNESPYAMFGDTTIILKTEHERNLDHSLKIPLIEDNKQVGFFELDFQTGVASIFDMNRILITEEKLSNDQFARFLTIDPHAEKYYSWSPYAYVGNNPMRFIDPDGRDWIENNKTGNVEWRKEINQDNVPKGYNYVGTEYQGISILKFEPTNYETSKGHYSVLAIEIGYKDPSTGEQSNYNWVQTVERNDLPLTIDPVKDNGNRPFYQDKAWNKESQNVNGYNAVFSDKPNENQSNGYFNAELSLMSNTPDAIQYGNKTYAPNSGIQGQKIYNPIITVNYGFSVKNGNMSTSPIRVVQPSSFQMRAIRKIP